MKAIFDRYIERINPEKYLWNKNTLLKLPCMNSAESYHILHITPAFYRTGSIFLADFIESSI